MPCRRSATTCKQLVVAPPAATLLSVLWLLSATAGGLGGGEAASIWLTQAHQLRIADDPAWLTLLHVERTWYGVRRSLIDDPAFFLHPNGKHDPQAELEATLAGLFAERQPSVPHVFDRFPARCEFLIEQLGIDRQRLPVSRCQAFEEAYAALGPGRAFLVFPTAYMNTPASMFGHTLLVIGSRLSTGMAGQAINYAASTGDDGGVLFAFKGIFGGYPGYYSLLPYWQKLAEYRDLDQRDIWEYELNLTPEEVRRLLMHVWELRGIASDYFFFDENCAYKLLYLLDVARPGLNLHAQAAPWVIPLDTVRLAADAGLVVETRWRPSLVSQVRARVAALPAEASARARAIARGELAPQQAGGGAAAQAVAELELAADYLQALRNRRRIDVADYQPRFVSILRQRAQLGAGVEPPMAVPSDPPDQGHRAIRLGLGGGVSADRGFVEAHVRPAYHALLDPLPGYEEGTQVEFAGVTLRWYQDAAQPTLERLDAVTLRSLTPRDSFFSPPSWSLDSGVNRELTGSTRRAQHHAFVDVGVGGSWRLGAPVLASALVHADGRLIDADPSFAAGAGPALSAIVRWQGLTLAPALRWMRYVGDASASNWMIRLQASVALHPNLALSGILTRQESWDALYDVLSLRVDAYF